MIEELRKKLPKTLAALEVAMRSDVTGWQGIDTELRRVFLKAASSRLIRGPMTPMALYNRERREKEPHKVQARLAVLHAKQRGALVPGPCARCGIDPAVADIQAHHEDYSRPLDVTWLCRSCHGKRHGSEPVIRQE